MKKYQIICVPTDHASERRREELVFGDVTYVSLSVATQELELARARLSHKYEPGFERFQYFIRVINVDEPEDILVRRINTKVPFHKKPDGDWLNVTEVRTALRELIKDGTIEMRD